MADYHDDVRRRLEDAGRTLMMLPMPKDGMPAGNRAAWPDVLQGFWDVMGLAEEGSVEERMEALAQVRNAVTLRANPAAIERLDEVLGWLWHIRIAKRRRLVAARMQINPLSDRHVFSWRRLARDFAMSPRQLQRWHEDAIREIVNGLAAGNVGGEIFVATNATNVV